MHPVDIEPDISLSVIPPSELATVLQTKQESDDKRYKYQLKCKQDEIIKSFGGLHRLLQLYLTRTIDDNVISTLHSILSSPAHDDGTDIIVQFCNVQHRQMSVEYEQKMNQLQPQFVHDSSLHMIARNDRSDRTFADSAQHVVPTIVEQRRLFVPEVLKFDTCDNICFRILKSRQTARLVYRKVVKNKYMQLIMVLLLLSCIGIVIRAFMEARSGTFVFATSPAFYAWKWGFSWIFIIWAGLHVLGLNVELMKEITTTFDFGYKLWQGALLMASVPPLLQKRGYSTYDGVLCEFMVMIGFCFICYLDASSMNIKFKLVILFCQIILITFVPFYVYLYFDDVLWDPFNGAWGEGKTVISYKAILINALINAILLFCKAFGFGLKSYFVDRKNPNKKVLIDKGYTTSTLILSRPFIRWIDCQSDEFYRPQQMRSLTPATHLPNSTNSTIGIPIS